MTTNGHWYKPGTRLKLSPYARAQGLKSQKNQSGHGTYLRSTRRGHLWVVQDGCKSANEYAPMMWELANA